jgi:hypothetical protein
VALLRLRKLLITLAAALSWPAAVPAQVDPRVNPQGRLEALLLDCSQNGYIEMELFTIVASGEAEALGKRLADASERDPEWFQNYLLEHINERPLPYHEKFGLTKQEYFHFFELYEKSRRFAVVRMGRISVSSKGNGRFRFDGGKSIPWLPNITIDLRKDSAEVPGHPAMRGKPHSEGLLEPVGKIEGFRWKTGNSGGDPPDRLEDFNYHGVELVVASDKREQLVIQFRDVLIEGGERDPDHATDTIMRYTGRSTRQGNLQ